MAATRPDWSTAASWPARLDFLGFGGDYNPEQWPRSVRSEDIDLMREAGVSVVSVGIFSWALLEPVEGEHDFGWLDEVMDNLHGAGVRVALSTATAAPPAWLTRKHPEILPRLSDGTTLWPGSRRHYSPSSPAYQYHAQRITRVVAERYKNHPALALWHLDNELGAHVSEFYDDDSAAAFRRWLENRYGTIEELNRAWGTAFWSQHYAEFEEILPPRATPTSINPTQRLDFQRFSSWSLLEFYRGLVSVIREVTPGIPATTNLMATTATKSMDYFSWAGDLDVVANDHYLVAADPERHIELAFSADLTRGIAGGNPWILMEHSTSAVNWQPRNRAKTPNEMRRNSLAHVARGADAVMFFQWRQSLSGAEKFHSALVPHAGTDTRMWREVVDLGRAVRSLESVRGSRVDADVAIVFDYEAWWAIELDSHPSNEIAYLDTMRAYHRALWLRGISADIVHPEADLSRYKLVLVCSLYLVTDVAAANIARAAKRGASVLVTYFSGIVDENDHVRPGGYPGAFRELLGVRTEEFYPLLADQSVVLSDGSIGTVWSEHMHLEGAEALVRFTDSPLTDVPALTRKAAGDGHAWYVATALDSEAVGALTDALLTESGVLPAVQAPAGVEVTRRRRDDGTCFLFAVNHTAADATIACEGTELLTGVEAAGTLLVPAGAVVVVQESSLAP
nr:beta-galactosidase [Cryobacterium sp. N19]